MMKGIIYGLMRNYRRQNTKDADYNTMVIKLFHRHVARGWNKAVVRDYILTAQTRKKHGQKTHPTGHRQRKEPIPLDAGKRKLSISSSVSHSASIASGVSAMASIDLTSSDSPRRLMKKPTNTRQLSLSVPTPNWVAHMDVMVANFLQSNALLESLSD